jgi:uncharacterized membrane protein
VELTFQYFWLIKLAVLLLLVYTLYKAVNASNIMARLNSKESQPLRIINGWTIVSVVLIVLYTVQPVKMDVNTKAVTDRANQSTAAQKELPPMIQDESFNSKTNAVTGITKQDLE